MLVFALLPTAQAQATFDAVGECPGSIALSIGGMTPGGQVAIVSSGGTGAFIVPNGQPCAGTQLGLDPVGIAL
ncbi:MAG: hypothetical protein KC621_07600, partial [Myxococcales bacterium]|nr:hypothetical protein [Myxococcales bacterium]